MIRGAGTLGRGPGFANCAYVLPGSCYRNRCRLALPRLRDVNKQPRYFAESTLQKQPPRSFLLIQTREERPRGPFNWLWQGWGGTTRVCTGLVLCFVHEKVTSRHHHTSPKPRDPEAWARSPLRPAPATEIGVEGTGRVRSPRQRAVPPEGPICFSASRHRQEEGPALAACVARAASSPHASHPGVWR